LKDNSFAETTLRCPHCRTIYRQTTRAINMISDTLFKSSNIFETENVSSNPYEPLARELIETTTKKGGWVLDCGAGSRPERTPNVINIEIADYFSTDVLAVGEALPFHDNSFDGAVSLAVLEHVRDPFACAKELLRVVKPGSNIVCSVPFLQPVHGYPSHYYNMTQEGLKALFERDAKITKCFVPLHGHPIFCLQWFLSEYLRGLPEDVRAEFSKMTLGEAAKLVPHQFLTDPAACHLTTDAMNTIACLNTVVLEKHPAER
jgi:SAM-dependent methyltransferase